MDATNDATTWLSDIAIRMATSQSDLASKETLKCDVAMETVQCELLAMLDVWTGFPSIFVEYYGPVKVRRKFAYLVSKYKFNIMCCDHCHCPASFTYFVWQKGFFHPFPLTVGIRSTLISLLSLL